MKQTGRQAGAQPSIDVRTAHLADRMPTRAEARSAIARITRTGVPWPLVAELLNTPGLRTSDDVTGLCVLWESGFTDDEIAIWARLGSLDAAHRLVAKDIGPDVAAAFPIRGERTLADLLRMVQEASKHSIRPGDLLLWHTGGVLLLQPPYLDGNRFATWRRIAVHSIGWRHAALACAAGMSPTEAVTAVRDGKVSEATLRMLAGLRTGHGW